MLRPGANHLFLNPQAYANAMNSIYIRWRCERLEQLLGHMPRLEALAVVKQEEALQPWMHDPRPAPPPLPLGGPYGLNPPHLQLL